MSLFAELKRRNVFRVGVAYIVASWLLLQVTDVVVPILELPNSVSRFVLLILVLGFVLALILAWAYELTPDGIKRETDVDRTDSVTNQTGQKLNLTIISLMAIAIVFLVVDNYVLTDGDSSALDVERSIAVLPFRNRSALEEDAFFADGIHDDLLTQLSRVASLDKVISRTSTERYRDTQLSMGEIGSALGVVNIVEGGIQRAGDRVRVNVQLIDSRTDQHLWAKTYDKELSAENLFEIQTEITREIVTALHGVLSAEDDASISRASTTNLQAYEQYTLGRQQIAKRTADGVLQGRKHFEKAVELDETYVLAWVGLADAASLGPRYAGVPPDAARALHATAAETALDLDPLSGEAYTSLGMLAYMDAEFETAETYYQRAIELNPNYATAYHWYSILLSDQGLIEDSLQQVRKAIELDPLAPVLAENLAEKLQLLGRREDARVVLLDGLKDNPGFPGFYRVLAQINVYEGNLAEATRWIEEADRLLGGGFGLKQQACFVHLSLGNYAAGEVCIEELEARAPDGMDATRGFLFFARGDEQGAIDYLEEIATQRPAYRYPLATVYLLAGRWEEARELWSVLAPEMFSESDVTIDRQNVDAAVAAGAALYKTGDTARANYLFDLSLDFLEGLHRTRGMGSGIMDVEIHAIRGDEEQAVAALKEAYDANFRMRAFTLRMSLFKSLADNPEWNATVALFDEDLARQREFYEANKDKPLF